MARYDLLIKGATLVDPGGGQEGQLDVAITGGRVERVEPDIPAQRGKKLFDAPGKLVLPGLVDTHVHLTPPHRAVGFRMLAKAGVTCCLDCGGPVEDIVEGLGLQGSGISVAVLNKLDPGQTISGPDASKVELQKNLDRSLETGALGLKLLGGHLPLSPETTSAAIQVANEAFAYVAFHCGSTRNGSNLHGLLDAFEFAGSNRFHVCHVNAYCRGLTHGSTVKETQIALAELAARPHLVSESYPAPFNSCWARLENYIPRSHVTRTCLEAGGFEASGEGLLAAAKAGYLKVQRATEQGVVFLELEEGADYLKATDFEAMVSFPVNHPSTAFLMATEKDENGRFIITAISTDGGGIPRNFLLSHGLSLVRFDAMTLSGFVWKCAWAPAQMLGLQRKGHLSPGADGDLIVVDPKSQEAVLTVANGKIVMQDGHILGSGGVIVTTERGQKSLQRSGVSVSIADLPDSLLYTGPRDDVVSPDLIRS